MSVTRFDQKTETQLREIVRDGTTSFKIFLSYKNFFGVDDSEMYQTLTLAKELGVIVAAHCENAELISRLQQALLAEGGVRLSIESVLPHLLLDKTSAERAGLEGMRYALRLKSPIVRSGPSKTRLNFVRDADAAHRAHVLVSDFQITIRKNDRSTDSLN